jgi:hypothetical protein
MDYDGLSPTFKPQTYNVDRIQINIHRPSGRSINLEAQTDSLSVRKYYFYLFKKYGN